MDLAFARRRGSGLNVLLVEDDELDALNLRRALQPFGQINPLIHACDGAAALALLRGPRAPHAPLVILLDIRMPRMNGLELLRAMREDDELASIPVVMLTTSADPSDLAEAYRLGAAGYLLKAVDCAEFKRRVRSFAEYWTHQELPA